MLALLVWLIFFVPQLAEGKHHKHCSLPAMFVFGDSYLDNGNKAVLAPEAFQQGPLPIESNKAPYGVTFFGHPTGRFSDGRMMGDFLANEFGLHASDAYLQAVGASFKGGVNFALSQGTALPRWHWYYVSRNISLENPYSLMDQYAWFLGFKHTVASRNKVPVSSSIYSNGLYVVGEIGSNDYTAALFYGTEDPRAISHELTPLVMQSILNVTEKLYLGGARKFLFIGMPPAVDSPGIKVGLSFANKDLLYFMTSNHNRLLRKLIKDFKSTHEDVMVAFADFEGIHKDVMAHPKKYGFANVVDACCGGAGEFNFNWTTPCGQPGYFMCRDPNKYVYWDFSHYTEHFNKVAVCAFARGDYIEPTNAFSKLCKTS